MNLLGRESSMDLMKISQFEMCNLRMFIQSSAQTLLKTDDSLTSWGTVWEGIPAGKKWSQIERKMHINNSPYSNGQPNCIFIS